MYEECHWSISQRCLRHRGYCCCLRRCMHVWLYMHTYICTQTHTYIRTPTQADNCVELRKSSRRFLFGDLRIYTHTYTHTCIHTYIHTYIYAYEYTHAYLHRRTAVWSCASRRVASYSEICVPTRMQTAYPWPWKRWSKICVHALSRHFTMWCSSVRPWCLRSEFVCMCVMHMCVYECISSYRWAYAHFRGISRCGAQV